MLTICWKFPNPSFSFVPRLNPRVRCFLHSGMRECIPVGTCSRRQLLFFGPVTHLRYAIQQSASRIYTYRQVKCLNEYKNSKCRSPRIKCNPLLPIFSHSLQLEKCQICDTRKLHIFPLHPFIRPLKEFLVHVEEKVC